MLAYQHAVIITLIAKARVQIIGQFAPDLIPWSQSTWNDAPDSHFAVLADQYAAQAGRIAALVPQVVMWECFNEPNCYDPKKTVNGKKGGNTYIAPERYYRLMTAVHTAVKAANPAAQIILGGMFSHDIAGINEDSAGVTYLRAMYDQAPLPSLAVPWDHVGLHLYLDRGGPVETLQLKNYLMMYSRLLASRHTSARIHITEAGWSTHAVSEQVQAENLMALFDVARNHPAVASALWFSLADVDQDASKERWGLTDSGLTPKPAYAAFTAQPKG